MSARGVWFARMLPAAIGIAAIAAAAAMLAVGSRSVPHLETARISQFRMGPIGSPVSQTIRSGGATLTTIELPLTSRSEFPVRIAVRVWSGKANALVREALVEVPPGTEDAWTRIDFDPLDVESDDTLEFQFFLPEQETGEVHVGAGLQDQYPEGRFKDHDGNLPPEQDLAIRVWANVGPAGFLWRLAHGDPLGVVVVAGLMLFIALAVFAESSKRLPRLAATLHATAAPMLAFALMYRLPEISF